MRSLVRSILIVSVIGAVQAVHRDRRCRCLGIDFPGTATQHALTVGSGMSAPPLLLGALVISAERDRTGVVGVLAALMVAGILGEPNTWKTLRQPGTDPLSTVCVVLEIALPAKLAWDTSHHSAVGGGPVHGHR